MLELAVILLVVYIAHKYLFPGLLSNELVMGVVVLVFSGLSKYTRATESGVLGKVPDFVNGDQG
ncbi:hypothetical protein A2635_01055 [Candidatus Peribacteria bacterium RIFCSPHIGHO2_01_FULL_51_9]|nr:MAG: hypothetical protein A2635_01055 [Candidatus Peribacteria bacterium RIFCSPHIGHO2_01_FULL_51_9]